MLFNHVHYSYIFIHVILMCYKMHINIKILLPLCLIKFAKGWSDTTQRRFPETFMFGVGSAAYQVEGAWNIDGKGESIWDKYLHEYPEVIPDGRNGDEACDSYHQYKRDVEMLRELGVDHYRFSISWPRVLPSGFPNNKNEKGFQYYDNLINELIKYNIEPMVTLFHFDLPQALQDLGGWANPLSAVWFEDYANEIFQRYADKVKFWITINQPNTICVEGYGSTVMAPGVGVSGIADYICVKNVLLAHARVYRLFQKNYKSKFDASVGIAISVNWADPLNNKTENVKAAEEYREFSIGLYMEPIWGATGDFPKVVKDIVAKKSQEQGFPRSRLPVLSAGEKKLLKGSADFLGMNHYTTFLVKRAGTQFPSPSFEDDVRVELSQSSEWIASQSSWLKSAPYGLYKASLHINKQYDYPYIIITEHGWSTSTGLRDQDRATNLWGHATALLLAIEDGTRVAGYTAWSLADNVEWTQGTSECFGLYEVDFDSKEKTRTARLSALVYRRLIEGRVVEADYQPDSLNIDISDRRLKMAKKKVEL